MREIPVTEAKMRVSELLRLVEHGETIVITRHGKQVAHLVPAPVRERANRKRAVELFRQRRAQMARGSMSVQEILDARHEGHRF